MSYEGKMLEQLKMPSKHEIEQALLKSLFKHNGVIKEFGAGEQIVNEIASDFHLSEEQTDAYLETIYKKENRVKRSSLWHRLLFRCGRFSCKGEISIPTHSNNSTHK